MFSIDQAEGNNSGGHASATRGAFIVDPTPVTNPASIPKKTIETKSLQFVHMAKMRMKTTTVRHKDILILPNLSAVNPIVGLPIP
ncbi:unnamed protein product [[Candida] boidinii]|nr:unnamed protein product [[Candida] boidinii]